MHPAAFSIQGGEMSAISDLKVLLASMDPQLAEGEYLYCTTQDELAPYLHLQPAGMFREAEGWTLILPATADTAGLAASGAMRMITLNVHSSLEAVGLTAAFAAALTKAGISANVVAGYYHDHIFVPAGDAERAIEALRALSADAPA